jgi:hypothetical protein
MDLQRSDGTALDPDGITIAADDNAERADHIGQARDRVIDRWDLPRLQAILESYTTEVSELEVAIWSVIVERMLPYAVGVQLDTLGSLVGQARNGRTDDEYRIRVRVRIQINRSFGTAPQLIAILQAIVAGGFHVTDTPPASFRIELDDSPDAGLWAEVFGVVRDARAAGVGSSILVPTDSDSIVFDDDGNPTPDETLGFGDDSGDNIPGGYLADERAA